MLPTFHNGQRYVYQNKGRFTLLVCGRRWRKTSFGSAFLFKTAWGVKGDYLWGSPTHDQNKIALANMIAYSEGKLKINRSEMSATFPSGSRVLFRSLNKPDNARGFTLSGVVLDEAAYINSESWLEVLRPTLIDTQGWGLIMSTPNSYNWIYDLSLNPDYKYFNSPTLGCVVEGNKIIKSKCVLENDSIPFDEIVSLFNSMDIHSFRQEILAEFISSTIHIFSAIKECSVNQPLDSCRQESFAGFDIAKVNDYSAVSIFIIENNKYKEIYVTRLPQVDYSIQIAYLKELFERFNVRYCTFDATGVGKAVEEFLLPLADTIQFKPFVYTHEHKQDLISNMLILIQKNQVSFIDDKIATAEALAFVRKLNGNTVVYNAEKGNDDTVNARALALSSQSKIF